MKYLIILLLLIFPLGQLGRYAIPGTEIVIQLNDLAVALFVFFSFFRNSQKIIAEIKTNSLSKPILIFILAMIISLIVNIPNFSVRQFMISSLYPIRWIFYSGLYYCITVLPKEHKVQTMKLLTYAVFTIAIVGILQYVFLPDVSFLKAFNWDDHYFRAVSTFLDPGFTGAILVLGLILIFSSFWGRSEATDSRIFLPLAQKRFWTSQNDGIKIIQLIILYVAIALTYSRASYLMYLVSFGVISIYKKSIKMFIIVVLVLAITIPLLPKSTGEGTKLARESSITARIRNWQESISIWQKRPIFGVGFDTYRYVRTNITPQSHSGAGADSSMLLILATTGLVGFSAYLFLLLKIWKTHRRNALILASFAGILIHSFFNNTLFYPWVMEWLWILLAIFPNNLIDD